MSRESIEDTYQRIAQELEALKGTYERLLYVGRFCPMHFGHQAMMGGIQRAFPDKHIVLVGSCNERISFRNLFNYKDRTDFIRTIFPNLNIAAMPDFKDDDNSWFGALDDMIRLSGGDPKSTAFIGGCSEDVQWYYHKKRNVHIVNRFGGTTLNISGTEIRDSITRGEDEKLDKMIDPRIVPLVRERFALRWDELRSM